MAIKTLQRETIHAGGEPGVYVMKVERQTELEAHDHVFHELVYVDAGSADHKTAGGVRQIRPGDVIVMRPQVWHAYLSPSGLTIYNCLVSARLIQRLGAWLDRVPGTFDLFRKRAVRPRREPPIVLHASPARRQVIRSRLAAIMTEQDEQHPGWEAAATGALLELLVLVARLNVTEESGGENEAAGVSDRTERAVLDAVSYVEQAFDQAIDLPTLARRVHLSPGHLSRNFTRRMGMGVIEFMHRLRAEEACRLLQATDHAIGQIGATVGYDEIAYFSKCFRRHVGVSPSEYRRSHVTSSSSIMVR